MTVISSHLYYDLLSLNCKLSIFSAFTVAFPSLHSFCSNFPFNQLSNFLFLIRIHSDQAKVTPNFSIDSHQIGEQTTGVEVTRVG